MGATALIVSAVATTAAAGLQAYQSGEQAKEAKKEASKQKQQADAAITEQEIKDKNTLSLARSQGSAVQARAIQAIRAAMTASGSSGGTILSGTGATNTTAAPIQTKTLLGV